MTIAVIGKQAHGQGECAGDHKNKKDRDRGHNMDKKERYPESVEQEPNMCMGGLGVKVGPIE